MKTYEQAIADAAAAFNEYLIEDYRPQATVTTIHEAKPEQAPRRRQRTRKAA